MKRFQRCDHAHDRYAFSILSGSKSNEAVRRSLGGRTRVIFQYPQRIEEQ